MKEYSIIDSHCHIYPEKITEKAVAGIESFYDYRYRGFDGSISTMLHNGTKAGVNKFVIFSVATSPRQVSSINRFIAEKVKEYSGVFIGLGTLHPDSENLKDDFEELLSLGLKGVKLHPDIQQIAIDDDRVKKIYSLCSGKIPVLLHTGDYRYDYSNPDRMKRVLEEFSECTFIGAHFGGWSVWDEAAEKLSSYPNFYVDTSSTFSDISTEKLSELINKYTSDKILFGTDYPLGDSVKEISVLKKVVTDDADLKKILCENAKNLFNLAE